ncbi:MAG: hypothetical protein R3F11_24325 [Verrucomicrobiales bacterium]
MKTRSFLRTAAFSAAGAALGSAAAAAEETPAGTAARPEVDAEGIFYLDNGRIRLGAKRDWGCGIAWFSQSGAKRNLVNHWDHGRLIQQSYYGKADGSKWGEKPWRWNPVQGGDYKGRAAKVLAVDLGKDWFASKSQARHWASGADLPDVIFEQRAELMGEVAHVRFKMTLHRRRATSRHAPRDPRRLRRAGAGDARPLRRRRAVGGRCLDPIHARLAKRDAEADRAVGRLPRR